MSETGTPPAPVPVDGPGPQADPARRPAGADLLRDVLSASWLMTVCAIVLALVFGAVLIAGADPDVQSTAGYLLARPTDFFTAVWQSVSSAYVALFQGAVFDWTADNPQRAIRPLTETLTISVPLILAGLAVGIGFRAGLFNIGAQGQITLGAVIASWIGFTLQLPVGVHLVVALVGGIVGGAVWAAIAGVLKARTGAHEVIVTIMLNNIAVFGVLYLLTTSVFRSATPQVGRSVMDTAMLPQLLGAPFRLHLGFPLALLAALGVWWLMERSTLGFRFRAVGSNPHAARTAGISVPWVTVTVMAVSGALAGLAGGMQLLGTERSLTAAIAGSIGFDAITVALLGRSKPWGTVLAGVLFGAFAAGGRLMQTRTGTPIDIVLVLQSLIVLFIAAPPLVRAVFRLPAPGARRSTSEAVA